MSYKGLNDMHCPSRPTAMSVLGGSAEVSQIVALQLDANLDPDDSLNSWCVGITEGEKATWSLKAGDGLYPGQLHTKFLTLSYDYLTSAIDEKVATLAKDCFSGRRHDKRMSLARKAATIIHKIYNQNDYGDTIFNPLSVEDTNKTPSF